jgi:hypothetical protein
VDNIDKARVIRDFVLLCDEDVEWGSTVFQDTEHQCWHIRCQGWRATVSTLWDVMNGRGRERAVDPDHRFELSQQSILEVFEGEYDGKILGISYGSEPEEDLLYAYDADRCEEVFKYLLVGTQINKERRTRRAAVVYSTAFAA